MTREIQIKYTIGKDISYAPMRRSSFSSPKDVKKKKLKNWDQNFRQKYMTKDYIHQNTVKE